MAIFVPMIMVMLVFQSLFWNESQAAKLDVDGFRTGHHRQKKELVALFNTENSNTESLSFEEIDNDFFSLENLDHDPLSNENLSDGTISHETFNQNLIISDDVILAPFARDNTGQRSFGKSTVNQGFSSQNEDLVFFNPDSPHQVTVPGNSFNQRSNQNSFIQGSFRQSNQSPETVTQNSQNAFNRGFNDQLLSNQGSLSNNSLNQVSINQNSFNQLTTHRNSFNQNAFNQGFFGETPLNQGTVSQNLLNQGSFNQNSFTQNSSRVGSGNRVILNSNNFNRGPFNNRHGPHVQIDRPNTFPQTVTQNVTPAIPILYEEKNGPHADGSYSFRYESADGSKREEIAQRTGPDTLAVRGSYSYFSPEGDLIEVRYVADEFGFRAEGPHIPTTPRPLQIQQAEQALSGQRRENGQRLQPVTQRQPTPPRRFQQVPSFQQQGNLHTQSGLNHQNTNFGLQNQFESTQDNTQNLSSRFQSRTGSTENNQTPNSRFQNQLGTSHNFQNTGEGFQNKLESIQNSGRAIKPHSTRSVLKRKFESGIRNGHAGFHRETDFNEFNDIHLLSNFESQRLFPRRRNGST